MNLYIPKIEDYWYEEKLLNDKDTMSYNAGWEVSYDGYNYDTGCISFPKNLWQSCYEKRIKENKFFAYVVVNNEYVGYVNYHYNLNNSRYECGIVIEASKRGLGYSDSALKLLINHAKKNGIEALYDDFEDDRNALKLFLNNGFVVVDEYSIKRFNRDVNILVVKCEIKN